MKTFHRQSGLVCAALFAAALAACGGGGGGGGFRLEIAGGGVATTINSALPADSDTVFFAITPGFPL